MLNERLEIAKIKLQKAQEKLRATQSEYNDLVNEYDSRIDDARSKIDEAESKLEKARKEYEFLSEQFARDKTKKPKNDFEKKFYQATHFCRKEFADTHYLSYVKVEKDRMVACNGFAAIIIKCNEIPENLTNKLVPWDAIGDAIDFQKTKTKHLDLDKIINDAIQNASHSQAFSKSSLLEIIEKIIKVEDYETAILNFATVKIAINKKYLDYAMDCFEGTESFAINWKDEKSPIVFRNNDVTVLILPIRLPNR